MDDKFIKFEDITPEGRKTKIFKVSATEGGINLGEIRFWGAWRKYTFHPASNTIFDNDCLLSIGRMLNRQNRIIRAEWKSRREARR